MLAIQAGGLRSDMYLHQQCVMPTLLYVRSASCRPAFCGHANRHVCAWMCRDESRHAQAWVDMCVEYGCRVMRRYGCGHMCGHMCGDMCGYMCVDQRANTWVETCAVMA